VFSNTSNVLSPARATHLAAQLAQIGRRPFSIHDGVRVADHNGGGGPGEVERDRTADPGAAAGSSVRPPLPGQGRSRVYQNFGSVCNSVVSMSRLAEQDPVP
jgi:hypothetical protein